MQIVKCKKYKKCKIQNGNCQKRKIEKQCKGNRSVYGSSINILSELKQNSKENCIPESIFNGTVKNYEAFLEERRKLMAKKIRDYYENL